MFASLAHISHRQRPNGTRALVNTFWRRVACRRRPEEPEPFRSSTSPLVAGNPSALSPSSLVSQLRGRKTRSRPHSRSRIDMSVRGARSTPFTIHPSVVRRPWHGRTGRRLRACRPCCRSDALRPHNHRRRHRRLSSPAGTTASSSRRPTATTGCRLASSCRLDGRFALDDPLPIINTFVMRKARPAFTGRVARFIDFKLMPELAGGSVSSSTATSTSASRPSSGCAAARTRRRSATRCSSATRI